MDKNWFRKLHTELVSGSENMRILLQLPDSLQNSLGMIMWSAFLKNMGRRKKRYITRYAFFEKISDISHL